MLNLTLTLPISLPTQTYFYIVLPTAYYSVALAPIGYEIDSQNSTFIKLKRLISECTFYAPSSGICTKSQEILYFILKVSNQKYLNTQTPKPKITFYLIQDNSSVSNQVEITLNEKIPNVVPGLTLERNNVSLGQKVNNTLKCNLTSSFNISKPLKVSIVPVTSPIGLMKSI